MGFLSDPSQGLMGQLGMPPDAPLPAVFVLHQAKETPAGAAPGAAATSLIPYDPMMFGKLGFRSLLNFVLSAYHTSGYAAAKAQQQQQDGGSASAASTTASSTVSSSIELTADDFGIGMQLGVYR